MAALELVSRVKSNEMITPTVFQIQFEPSSPVSFKAGQFLSMIVPGAGPKGRDLRRAYSIASAPESPVVELCVKIVEGGPGTTYLKRLRAGDSAKFFAPYGDFVLKSAPQKDVYFIATGTGISPFRAIAQSLGFKNRTGKTTLIAGVREQEEVLYSRELGQIHGLNLVQCVSRPTSSGPWLKGRVTDFLQQNRAQIDWAQSDFYMCGNGAMIDEVKSMLLGLNVAKEQIFQEVYYKTPKSPVSPVENTI